MEIEFNADGSKVRRSLECLRPAGTIIIFEDPAQPGRFYNGKGERCDEMGRLLEAKGQKDVHSSKGKNYPTLFVVGV